MYHTFKAIGNLYFGSSKIVILNLKITFELVKLKDIVTYLNTIIQKNIKRYQTKLNEKE